MQIDLFQILRFPLKPTSSLYRAFSAEAGTVSKAGALEAANGGHWFGLSEEQKEIVELAKKFTREEIIPVAAQYDKTMEFPMPIVKKAWELGFLNNHVPEVAGGTTDSSVVTSCLITEEFAYGKRFLFTSKNPTKSGI